MCKDVFSISNCVLVTYARRRGLARRVQQDSSAANCGQEKMNRITQLDPVQATGKTKQLFEAVQTKLGVVPNLFRILGVSPAALQGYLDFNDALATGSLNSKIREQI